MWCRRTLHSRHQICAKAAPVAAAGTDATDIVVVAPDSRQQVGNYCCGRCCGRYGWLAPATGSRIRLRSRSNGRPRFILVPADNSDADGEAAEQAATDAAQCAVATARRSACSTKCVFVLKIALAQIIVFFLRKTSARYNESPSFDVSQRSPQFSCFCYRYSSFSDFPQLLTSVLIQ